MDDDAIELVDKIKTKVEAMNYRIANAVYNYYTSNEFNSVLMFQSEFEDKQQCYLLDVLKEHFQLRHYQTDWIYNTIYEVVFGVKPPESDEEDYDSDELQEKRNEYLDDATILKPVQLNYSVSHYQVSKTRALLNKHFPRLGQSYGHHINRIMRIIAVGHNHKIDLLSLLFDIFTEYRVSAYFSTKQAFIPWKEYLKLPFFASLPEDFFIDYDDGMDFYVRKFQHVAPLIAMHEINDSYFQFVRYTFALTQSLAKLKHLFHSGEAVPFQIDLWIIPNTVIQVSDTAFTGMPQEFDYVDDSDDDIAFVDELKVPNSDDDDHEIGKIEQRLDSAKCEYIKEILNHNDHKNAIVNKMLNAIQFITRKEYKFKRLVMIIDRRHSSSKLNKNSDRLYLYQPNKPYGEIIKEGWFHETFQSLSVGLILPKLIHENRGAHINVLNSLSGRMFTLSFHIHSWQKIRCYMYNQAGCCTRFWPAYLYKFWPIFFFNDTNRDGFKKVNKEMVDNEWKLPLNDKIFEVWYPLVTGKQLW